VKLIVAISDLQVPYHSERAVKALEQFITQVEPDDVICVGDEMDMPTVGRWNKGLAAEYLPVLGKQRDETCRIMERLKIRHVMRSNHTDRLQTYLRKYAPALHGLPELELPAFLRYEELGITYHREPWEFATGWAMLHGDEGSMSQAGGVTALGLAKRIGRSVLCGHTHRMGLTGVTEMFRGKALHTLWGFEVGHLMDTRKAHYIKAGASWQMGFGVFWVDGKKVQPVPVPMNNDGSFTFEGTEWTA
jgi:hypothetical protein